jgi:hypothetical protein
MQTLLDSGYRALENRKGNSTVGAIGIGVPERKVLLEAMDRTGAARRLSCRNARPAARSAAGPSIPACWPGATPGITTTAPPGIAAKAKAIGAVCDTGCHCRPQPPSFRWRTRRSQRSSQGRGGCGIRGQPEAAAALDPAGIVARSAAKKRRNRTRRPRGDDSPAVLSPGEFPSI